MKPFVYAPHSLPDSATKWAYFADVMRPRTDCRFQPQPHLFNSQKMSNQHRWHWHEKLEILAFFWWKMVVSLVDGRQISDIIFLAGSRGENSELLTDKGWAPEGKPCTLSSASMVFPSLNRKFENTKKIVWTHLHLHHWSNYLLVQALISVSTHRCSQANYRFHQARNKIEKFPF